MLVRLLHPPAGVFSGPPASWQTREVT
jgi:hypothetical protein